MAKLPTEGLSLFDIARALSSTNIDEGSLCTHERINKWSKWKSYPIETTHEVTYAQIRDFTEGGIKKPFGLLPVDLGVNEYYASSSMFPVSDPLQNNEENLLEHSVWAYSRPKNTKKDGTPSDEPLDGEYQPVFVRSSDFFGYDHTSVNPFSVTWETLWKEVDDEYPDIVTEWSGVRATVKLVASSEEYGGLLASDLKGYLGTQNLYLKMFVFTKEAIAANGQTGKAIHALGSAYDAQYIEDGNEYVFEVHSGVLKYLPTNAIFVIALVNQQPQYGLGENSFNKYTNIYYFPKIENYANLKSYVVEGGVFVYDNDKRIGTTIYMTDGEDNRYARFVNLGGSEYNSNHITLTHSDTTNYGFNIRFNNELFYDEFRGVTFRSLAFGGMSEAGDYFNYAFKDGYNAGCKPLLKNLPIKRIDVNKSTVIGYKADIYIQYTGQDDAVVPRLRVRSDNGTLISDEPLNFGFTFKHTTNVIRQVSIYNNVNQYGESTGVCIKVGYSNSYTNQNVSGTKEIYDYKLKIEGSDCFFYLPRYYEANNNVGIQFGLPDGLNETLGGKLRVDYGVYDSSNTPFTRG